MVALRVSAQPLGERVEGRADPDDLSVDVEAGGVRQKPTSRPQVFSPVRSQTSAPGTSACMCLVASSPRAVPRSAGAP